MRSILTHNDMPLAELCAMRLDGVVVAVGPAFSPLDEIPDAAQRAAALATVADHRLVVERSSAAWVWGAVVSPPVPVELCTAEGVRFARAPERGVTVREVVISEDEVTRLEGVAVTTPARTAADLLRFLPHWREIDQERIQRLLELTKTPYSAVIEALDRHKLSFRRRALVRLDSLTRS